MQIWKIPSESDSVSLGGRSIVMFLFKFLLADPDDPPTPCASREEGEESSDNVTSTSSFHGIGPSIVQKRNCRLGERKPDTISLVPMVE